MATALSLEHRVGLGEQFAYQLAGMKYDFGVEARRAERLAAVAARAKELGAARLR